MEHEGSLPCSQGPVDALNPEPDEPSPHYPLYLHAFLIHMCATFPAQRCNRPHTHTHYKWLFAVKQLAASPWVSYFDSAIFTEQVSIMVTCQLVFSKY
jgi:hypothetical protein